MDDILVGQVLGNTPRAGLAVPDGKKAPLWQRRLHAEIATLDESVQRLVWAWLMHQRSPHTAAAYGRDLSEWLAFCADHDVAPLAVNRGHGDAYRIHLEQGCELSRRSTARKLAAVSSWYTYLGEESVIDANRFAGAKRPKTNRKESKTVGLTESEARAIVRAAEGDHGRQQRRTAAVIGLMLGVGPRVAEVVGLLTPDLGYERGMQTVRIEGKGGTVRTRRLPDEASEYLDAYLGDRRQRPDPVFVTGSGRAMLTRQVFDLVQRMAREAGLYRPERVTPHTLRHTFATLAIERGASLREVQEALGHESADTTEIYIHAARRLEDDPSSLVAKVLW